MMFAINSSSKQVGILTQMYINFTEKTALYQKYQAVQCRCNHAPIKPKHQEFAGHVGKQV